jgi:hypothetical protein
MARSVLLWFVLVIALASAACTDPNSGGSGASSQAPAAPAASAAPVDGY